MQNQNPLVPNACAYPLPKIIEEFGTYFTNTISWEIALAIHEGFKEIHIYGVDMAVDSEYSCQRASCEYFLGLAIGRGIKIWIPDAADLLKNRFLYGFQEEQALPYENKIKKVQQNIRNKRARTVEQHRILQKQIDQYTGADLAISEVTKVWKNVMGG